jgi:hypothetical protein
MGAITAYTDDSTQIQVIKAFFEALKIKYSVTKAAKEASPYDEAFVKKIQQGDEDLKNGKGRKVTIKELERLCK